MCYIDLCLRQNPSVIHALRSSWPKPLQMVLTMVLCLSWSRSMTGLRCILALFVGTSFLSFFVQTILISIRYLTQRGGTNPLSHAITYFDHVSLPHSALLGKLDKSADRRQTFFNSISRVSCGTMSMSSLGIPILQIFSTIAAGYSMRRTVYDHSTGLEKPIISFRTQLTPILTALAQSFVLKALLVKVLSQFTDTSVDPRVRHALAAITKAVMIRHTQAAGLELSERCGAQGYVAYSVPLWLPENYPMPT